MKSSQAAFFFHVAYPLKNENKEAAAAAAAAAAASRHKHPCLIYSTHPNTHMDWPVQPIIMLHVCHHHFDPLSSCKRQQMGPFVKKLSGSNSFGSDNTVPVVGLCVIAHQGLYLIPFEPTLKGRITESSGMELSGQCRKKSPHLSDRGPARVSLSLTLGQSASAAASVMQEMDFTKELLLLTPTRLEHWLHSDLEFGDKDS
ncbi:hypothetical protein F2P81_003480 [Scophthalmus maximus]|uniref:Uncharacterized protein n=1 Tax=Scophthalmus maximus TaxID=52904 RepID=A0A6A4TQP0_SCOMX|nr:hypothetical protein F2P81_003480 [Scophthalmus maximus]